MRPSNRQPLHSRPNDHSRTVARRAPAWELPTPRPCPELDGFRVGARVRGDGQVRLDSRNGRDLSSTFPEVAAALAELAGERALSLDGEVVAPDPATGAPGFGLLQQRLSTHPRLNCSGGFR